MVARLFGHDRAGGPPRRRRWSSTSLGPHRRRRPARARLLGGHAPPPRSRRQPRRRAPAAAARRADHRPRPAYPPRAVGRDPRHSSASGTDVLLTTQYLEEADQLADHVVIIDHGRAIATGTPSELKSRAGRDRVEIRVRHHADLGGGHRGARRSRQRGGPGGRRARTGASPSASRTAPKPTRRGSSRASTTPASRSTMSACAVRRSTRSSSR